MNHNQPLVIDLPLEEYEVSPSELKVYAIQAPEVPSYRLAHFMNATGVWNFYNTRLEYSPPEGRAGYKVYRFDDKIRHVKWFLLGKETDTPPLITRLPMADCFLMAAGSGTLRLDTAFLENTLTSLPNIFWVEALALTEPAGTENKTRKTPDFLLFSHFYNFLSYEKQLEEE